MNPDTRLTAGELVPLADRLRYMLMLRAALIASIATCGLAGPGLLGHLPSGASILLAAWATAAVAAAVIWRLTRRRALPLFGATLIIDGVALVWLSEVGSVTNVRYLIFLHMVAVVLLASYRTGFKMALWYTLLLYTVFFGSRQGAFGLTKTSPGVLHRSDIGQLSVFVAALWAVSLATAAFSSVNERELRRRRFDLEALAHFAVSLETAVSRPAVAEILLDNLAAAFPVNRLLLVSAGRRPTLLDKRGIETAPVRTEALDQASALARAQASRETLLVSGFDRIADPWLTALLGESGSFLLVPLYAEGGCLGVLVSEHRARPGTRVERRLVAIIERFASHAALALRSAALLEQMQQMASTDGLTQIANRRTFQASIEREIARSIRSGHPVSLIMFDIDHFKILNDAHGHQTGDEVLRELALVLRASSRQIDTVARYGGEEFAVILPGCDQAEAMIRAERLRRLINEGVKTVSVTVSLGVACTPANAQTASELIKAADDALYQAKRCGRDQVRGADSRVEPAVVVFGEAGP